MSWLHPELHGARRLSRVALIIAIITAVLTGLAGTSVAVPTPPPPPPNPGDSQLDAANSDARARAASVDQLVVKVSAVQSELAQVRQQLASRKDLANKALVDLWSALDAVTAADAAQAQAQQAVGAARESIRAANEQATRFAVGSYQQGSTIGSFSAYMGCNSPQDLLDRVALLNAVGGSQLKVMTTLQEAHAQSVAADEAAREAKQRADDAMARSAAAKRTADSATQAAVQAQQEQTGRAQQLERQASRAQYDLENARQNLAGLQGQRVAFEQWDAQRREYEAAAAKAAAEAVRAQVQAAGASFGNAPATPATPAAQAVIRRAASQLGMPYAWGGGSATGPTLVIRDGEVADSYGDFAKIGFDCSGLMMYAFAAANVTLAHYSGYQYRSGKQVPLGEIQPGDMVFYGPDGGAHVALYVGSGKMIEAPESGAYVTVSDLRLGGIMPFAVRML